MDGRPTRLVRDAEVLSHDPPTSHALFTDALHTPHGARRPEREPDTDLSAPEADPHDDNVETVDLPSRDGWHPDPFGVHMERYFNRGEPTRLVRNQGTASYDDPPSTDLAGAGPASTPHNADLIEPADGWRNDPLGRHEYRYFQNGRPTAYVTDSESGVHEDPPHQPPARNHLTLPRIAAPIAGRGDPPKRPKKERARRSIPSRCIDRVRSALPQIRRQSTKARAAEQGSPAADHDVATAGPPLPLQSPETSAPWQGETSGFSPEMSRSSEN
jgi:hypothetical protein